jgi:hypothetical protein
MEVTFYDQRTDELNKKYKDAYADITNVFIQLVVSYQPLMDTLQHGEPRDWDYPTAKQRLSIQNLPIPNTIHKNRVAAWFSSEPVGQRQLRVNTVALIMEEFYKLSQRDDYYLLALYENNTYVGHVFYSITSKSCQDCLVFMSIFKNILADSTDFAGIIIRQLEVIARNTNKSHMLVIGPFPHMIIKLEKLGYIRSKADMVKTIKTPGGAKKKPSGSLDKLTIIELRAKAAKRKISLAGLTKKADILAKIRGKE